MSFIDDQDIETLEESIEVYKAPKANITFERSNTNFTLFQILVYFALAFIGFLKTTTTKLKTSEYGKARQENGPKLDDTKTKNKTTFNWYNKRKR